MSLSVRPFPCLAKWILTAGLYRHEMALDKLLDAPVAGSQCPESRLINPDDAVATVG